MLAVHEDRLAAAVARLGSENAFEILARARELEAQGRRVVHMEIGEPDFDTPETIKKAAVDALYDNHTHYTPSSGLPSLRDDDRAICQRFSPRHAAVGRRKRRGRSGRQARDLEHAKRAARPGRRVRLLRSGLSRLRVLRELSSGEDSRDSVAGVAQLAHGSRRAGAPRLGEDESRRHQLAAQPDRRRPDPSDLEFIAELAQRYDFLVLADEIYSRNFYLDAEYVSIASLPGHARAHDRR